MHKKPASPSNVNGKRINIKGSCISSNHSVLRALHDVLSCALHLKKYVTTVLGSLCLFKF